MTETVKAAMALEPKTSQGQRKALASGAWFGAANVDEPVAEGEGRSGPAGG